MILLSPLYVLHKNIKYRKTLNISIVVQSICEMQYVTFKGNSQVGVILTRSTLTDLVILSCISKGTYRLACVWCVRALIFFIFYFGRMHQKWVQHPFI